MKFTHRFPLFCVLAMTLALFSVSSINAQQMTVTVLEGTALTKIVPNSFYFAGQSAPTQTRNSAAAQIGKDRYVLVGLVDTSGYSTEISGKYEGFLITDSPITIGDQSLETGAYGFGFSAAGTIKIFDLSSKEIASVKTSNDTAMNRPRPLAMVKQANGIRFYKGKNYVLISPK